jgi:hypothetical protein
MDHSKHNMGKMESTPKPVAKWIMLRIRGDMKMDDSAAKWTT